MVQILDIYQYDEDYLNKKVTRNLRFNSILGIVFTSIAVGLAFLSYHSNSVFWYIFTILFGFTAFAIVSDVIAKFHLERRINFILNTPIPKQLWRNQEFRSDRLTLEQKQLIEAGLRDFFILHALFPKRPLAMPSKMVDKLWHAFILDTKPYQQYCNKAFGEIFHHIPDYGFSDKGRNIQLFTWQSACRLQGIRPARPHTLPRLFGTDAVITGGLVIGSSMWLSELEQMGMMYQHWHAATFSSNSSGGSSCGGSDGSYSGDYDDSCDVGVTSDGDCSCGGSGDSGSCGGGGDGGSSCGGGCGGGGD